MPVPGETSPEGSGVSRRSGFAAQSTCRSTVSKTLLIVFAAALLTVVPRSANAATPIKDGDLIVSTGGTGAKVAEYTPSGTLVQTLMSSADGLQTPAGSAFDGSGNLYVTDFFGNQILKRDAATGAVSVFSNTSILGNGHFFNSPESIVFDRGYHKMYVSDANRFGVGGGINVVDASTGKGIAFYPLPSSQGFLGQGQSDWLAFDSKGTLFMTNENPSQGIMTVNQTSGDINLPSFVPNLSIYGFALSFDRNDDVWLGNSTQILEYDHNANLIRTITNSTFRQVFAAAFDPSGTTFYAGDSVNGNVYRYDSQGNLLTTFNAGAVVFGLSVAGALIPPNSQIAAASLIPLPFNALVLKKFKAPVALFVWQLANGPVPSGSAVINWGSGVGQTAQLTQVSGLLGDILQTLGLAVFQISGEHTFLTPGTANVGVQLSLSGFSQRLFANVNGEVAPLNPTPVASVNPNNPTEGGIVLMVPQPPNPLQAPIDTWNWEFRDGSHPVVDSPSMRPAYTSAINALLSDSGSGNFINQAVGVGLGILPPGLTDSDTVKQLALIWQAYFPMHIVPHIYQPFTGIFPVTLTEFDHQGNSGSTTFPVFVSDHCNTWGGGWIPGLNNYTTCHTAAGFNSVVSGPRRFPPDYLTLDLQGQLPHVLLSGGFSLTITHDKKVFLGGHAGVGVGGGATATEALGYVGPPDSPNTPPDDTIDGFVKGTTIPVGGQLSAFGLSVGVTLVLNPSTGTGGAEYFVGAGNGFGLAANLQSSCSVDITDLVTPPVLTSLVLYANNWTSLSANPLLPSEDTLGSAVAAGVTRLANCQ